MCSKYRPPSQRLQRQERLLRLIGEQGPSEDAGVDVVKKKILVRLCTKCSKRLEKPREVMVPVGKCCRELCTYCEEEQRPFTGTRDLKTLRTGDQAREDERLEVLAILGGNRRHNYGGPSIRYSRINGELARANG